MSSMCYDVEVTRNYFSVVFVDLRSYLKTFSDCVDNEGKAIPIIDKLSVAEIKKRLETIPRNVLFYMKMMIVIYLIYYIG